LVWRQELAARGKGGGRGDLWDDCAIHQIFKIEACYSGSLRIFRLVSKQGYIDRDDWFTMKIHLVYGSIIFILLVCIGYLGFHVFLWTHFLTWPDAQYRLTTTVDIVDPDTGRTLVTLPSGMTIRSPHLPDLSDGDLGDNRRFKILIDLDPKLYPFRKEEPVKWPQYILRKAKE
jgi:hypothetical protein